MGFLGKRKNINSKSGSKRSENLDVVIDKKIRPIPNKSTSKSQSLGEISAKVNSQSVKYYRSVEEIIELDKRIVQIQRSTRTTFKAMVPTHDLLRMKYGWYNRWHQTRISNPTHCLALVTAVAVVVFFFVANQNNDGKRYSQAADPVTFTSENALYSGDFEGVNGVAGLNIGWKSDDEARTNSTALGWSNTNFTRDAYEGDLAYLTTDSTTHTSQIRTMDFDFTGEEITISAWMKGNDLVTANTGGIVFSYTAGGAEYAAKVYLRPGLYGQPILTNEYQLFTITTTLTNASSRDIKMALVGPNWSNGTNASGAAIYFDNISLTFTGHPSYTLYSLTTDPFEPVYGAPTTITCPDNTKVVFTYPNCFTKDSEGDDAELSSVYVKLSIPADGQSVYFSLDGTMGNGGAPIATRYISYVPDYSHIAPMNSELYLSSGESSNWLKLSYPYIYLNALGGSTAPQKLTYNEPRVFFNAMSAGIKVSDAKFKIEIARDEAGTDIIKSHDVDGASSVMISVPRHVPATGDSGINFVHEEVSLDDQAEELDLENSIADQLTDVHFSTGSALGEDYLDDNFYTKQTSFLRKLGINGLNVTHIQGPHTSLENQQEAESQGFVNHTAYAFLNTQYNNAAYEFPTSEATVNGVINYLNTLLSGYDKNRIKVLWIFEEPTPPSMKSFVSSSTAQASFRVWLADLGLTPAFFGKSEWNEISMVLPENANVDGTSQKAWYYSTRFRYESITRFTDAVSARAREIVPNAMLLASHTDAFMALGGAVRQGIFWPDYARNSGINGMQTAYWENSAGSTITASMYSAMLRSGLTGNNFELFANLAHGWPYSALKQEIYSSFISGAKMFHFFNYGPDYLSVTDSASYRTDIMQAIKESTSEFVPVQSEIKNSTRVESETAILYSETSDIWHWVDDIERLPLDSNNNVVDGSSTYERERQGIFTALENNQIPTDMVTEQNINLDNVLANYKVLYVVGTHISSAAQQKIADWVANGGILYATTGAGMKDEYNQPSTILSDVLGISYSDLDFNYLTQTLTYGGVTRTLCCRTSMSLYYLGPSIWDVGHLYTTKNGTPLYTYCAKMDPLGLENITDPNMEIIEETNTETLFMKRQVGSGHAYYSNFMTGIAYLTKASIKYHDDRPYIAGFTYGHFSVSDYPGDDELAMILAPYNQSAQQRIVELSGDGVNSPNAVQIGVLSGAYAGKSYYLVPMNNFNQEVDGDMINKTLKMTVNTDPDLVSSVYSVKLGNLPFSKVTGAIEINSYTISNTDIIRINFGSPTIPPPTPPSNISTANTTPTPSGSSTAPSSTTGADTETATTTQQSSDSTDQSTEVNTSTTRRLVFGGGVTFEAPNIQSGSTYTWDFGDGSKAVGASATHYYLQVNRYKVSLTVKDASGVETVIIYTVDVVPPQPELADVSSNQKNVTLEGKALADTEILIAIHSDPYSTSSETGADGNFSKTIDFATTGLAYGDHKITLIARKTLEDDVTLDSDPKEYDAFFNLTEENVIHAGIREETPWYEKWYWIVGIMSGLILVIVGIVYLVKKRKGGGTDTPSFGGSVPVMTPHAG